ncbi:hypothetical protein PHMEG_00014028 [Phytophthora megakarya]|uniref:Uncharacterized protein n=1 Tax=Phytophthora megakarya TaxID=4795 RepID=A0A225W4U8_9STRA|nr:hypothetical protein PHMEG_00014028 [Phytophthora megakarya]
MTLTVPNYITSGVLISPSDCPWGTMYRSRDDGTPINLVSLPMVAFESMLRAFSRHYTLKSGPGKGGRPPRVCSMNNVLACILHFFSAAVEQKTICGLFGVVLATL